MTKKEFYKKLQEYGIVINGYKYQIIIGELRPVSYYLGIYKEDGKWLIYEVGDRGSIVYYYKGTDENEAFDKFYNDILIRLDDLGYMSKSITEDVIQTPKYYVYNFLQKKYNISESDAKDTWEYLLYDFHVLNEVNDKFYNDILIRLDDLGYMSKSITEDVIQTPKYYVYNFLQKKYNISESDAKDTWEYLLYDFHVLNEVKYFALNGTFVPSNDCYRVEGCSAQDIYRKTYLTEIGAYNYLIYLRQHPKQALKDLKDRLPRE